MASLSLRVWLREPYLSDDPYRSDGGGSLLSRRFPRCSRPPLCRCTGSIPCPPATWLSPHVAGVGVAVVWDLLSVDEADRTRFVIFSGSDGLDTGRSETAGSFSGDCLDKVSPISKTFPALLESRCNGALHVGQYCDSNSRMNS